MARPLRIEFPGAHYHVMSRGNDRRSIVRDDSDRQKWIDWLRRAVEIYGWRLHAFVLMTNHHHLFGDTLGSELHQTLGLTWGGPSGQRRGGR